MVGRTARVSGPESSRYAAEPLAGNTIVFLGGVHRSGTTLLARAVAQHPAVSGFAGTGVPEDEGEHLQSVYPDSWELGSVGRFGFAAESHLTEDSPLVTDEHRRQLFSEWSRYWDLGCPVLLEKSPPNMLKLRFLQALFPGSRAIVIVRHPLAVACAHLKWRHRLLREAAPHALLRHWIVCHEILVQDAPFVSDLLLVCYEDLVRDPRLQLSRIFAFLGLQEPSEGEVAVSDENAKYFQAWRAGWGNPARRAYRAAVERHYEPAIRRFGYSLREPLPLFPLSRVIDATVNASAGPRP